MAKGRNALVVSLVVLIILLAAAIKRRVNLVAWKRPLFAETGRGHVEKFPGTEPFTEGSFSVRHGDWTDWE
eukprot:5978115-Amphidinium_carterae.1